LVALLALLGAALYLKSHGWQLRGAHGAWEELALAALIGFVAAMDIAAGETTFAYSTFKRTEDPKGYWVGITLLALVALVALVNAAWRLLNEYS